MPEIESDIVAEAERVIAGAQAEKVMLRALGGVAVSCTRRRECIRSYGGTIGTSTS